MSEISPAKTFRYFVLRISKKMWRQWHLADPAHQEKLPDPAGSWKVELVAEGGGKAEVVEVAHGQVVRIFKEALLTLRFLVTVIFLQLRPGHAGFLAHQPSRVWRATPSIHLNKTKSQVHIS